MIVNKNLASIPYLFKPTGFLDGHNFLPVFFTNGLKENYNQCLTTLIFFFSDLLWKITITLAVLIIAGFMIYKAVTDNKSSTKTSLSYTSNEEKVNKDENMLNCKTGSIPDSQARFTYQPHNSNKVRSLSILSPWQNRYFRKLPNYVTGLSGFAGENVERNNYRLLEDQTPFGRNTFTRLT